MPDIDLQNVLVAFTSILISITLHEFGHAMIADVLGDPTPRRHGRVSLNPFILIKAEPFGTVVIPLIGAFYGFLFGYASTPVNPSMATRAGSLRRAEFLIAFAGPAANMILFLLTSVGLSAYGYHDNDPISALLFSLVLVNAILALFNLFPIPPLDGFTIFRSLLPKLSLLDAIERHAGLIFIVFIFSGSRIFGPILDGVYLWIRWLLHG